MNPTPATAVSLSMRELQVLDLAADGCTNAVIGQRLYLSEDTVKSHLRRAFTKLGVRDRTQAVAVAIARGALALPPGSTPVVRR